MPLDADGYCADPYCRTCADRRRLYENYDADGYSRDGYDRDGYDRDGYSRYGYDRDGYSRDGYDPNGYSRYGYNQYGYDRDGYSQYGYDRSGFDRDGYSRAGYNQYGYNRDGYSRDGYNPYGYDRDGYSRAGYNRDGYSREGYDRDGYDADGCHRDGYNADGYDPNGYSRDGYNRAGYDRDGYDREGYNGDGYDRNGYNENGYDQYGYNEDGYNEDGYNEDGYDEDGYDADGYNADGYDRDGCRDECCESPQQGFTVRNNGEPPLANDTRTTISLPADTIAGEGIQAIRDYLQREGTITDNSRLIDLSWDLDRLAAQWQTRDGNYTKRLSRLAYTRYQLKLAPEILSQVGCIARDHSAAISFAIEFTRQLNLPASDFANEDSCWWGSSYGESRCAFKTNGGLALRAFSDYYGNVTGRAWLMPLRTDAQKNLLPTFDTMTPAAFVVFNGYGCLSGYTPARIVAHMAGWTYRKISFDCSPMYVNSGSGYLIAPEALASQHTDGALNLRVPQHSNLFATEKEEAGNVKVA